MNHLLDFVLNKCFTISFPIKIGKDVSVGEWKYLIYYDFWSTGISVNRYITDNKFFLFGDGNCLVENNHIAIHRTYHNVWRIWFHYNTWLSNAYKTIYNNYEYESFASLKEAKQRVDSFLRKMQKLKCFV